MNYTEIIRSAFLLAGLSMILSCNEVETNEIEVSQMEVKTPVERLTFANSDSIPEAAITGKAHVYKSGLEEKLPIVMVPGLGLSAYIFTNTPDGRNSWAELFSEKGHTVYVYEDPSIMVHDVDYNKADISGNKWNKSRSWRTWGMGESYPEPYDSTRYPVDNFDSLVDSFPEYTNFSSLIIKDSTSGPPGGRGRGGMGNPISSEIKSENLKALIKEVGPCILMVHSASGDTGFETLRKDEESLIKGIIVIEPTGAPVEEKDVVQNFSEVPFLAVYGDYIDQRRQGRRKERVLTTIELINKNGGKAEMIDLPEKGIFGNTHLLMQDTNNAQIADMVATWINKNVNQKKK